MGQKTDELGRLEYETVLDFGTVSKRTFWFFCDFGFFVAFVFEFVMQFLSHGIEIFDVDRFNLLLFMLLVLQGVDVFIMSSIVGRLNTVVHSHPYRYVKCFYFLRLARLSKVLGL